MQNYLLAGCLFLIFSCNTKSDEDQIRECFDTYTEAVHSGDKETAEYCVSEVTFEFYDGILENMRNTDSIELLELPIFEQLLVVTLRNKFSSEEINEYNGRSLFKYLLNPESMDIENITNQEVGTVTVNGDIAETKIITMGSESPWGFTFYRTYGEWKIDITSLNYLGEQMAQDIINENNMTSTQYIVETIEIQTGFPPHESAWHPK